MGRYLVTGGAGFIGSHLVEHLLVSRHAVTVLDDFSTGRRENLPANAALSLMEADLLRVTPGEFSTGFDVAIHLAALPSVNDSWTQLWRAHERNLSATVRVLELAKILGIPRVVYASSAAVYGNPARVPVREDDEKLPSSPYGLQKLAGEHYGRLLAAETALTFVALRFFNVFGPRQVATSPYSGVISKFADALRGGGDLTINGDGEQTRDFIFVADIARAIARASEADGLERFTVCNLGTGRALSIKELAESMRGFFPEWRGAIRNGPALPGDIVHSRADTAAAAERLQFSAEVSLEAGLAKLLARA